MPRKLLIATRNSKKKRELQELMENWEVDLVTLDEVPGLPEVEEDGTTFAENAIKKARTIADLSGYITLADDSGLVVDALKGAPGIFSARFAGPQADDAANNRKLLQELEWVPESGRTARFVCVIAVAVPAGRVRTVQGICEGSIALEPSGEGGFGYDPLFIPQGSDTTFARMEPGQKHRLSHRGQALIQAQALLREVFGEEGTV
jgi:XTP/dITP diphosphohydrolase